MRWMFLTGVLLLIVSLAAAVLLLGTQERFLEHAQPIEPGLGFTGTMPLPVEEVSAALDVANEKMLGVNERGSLYARLAIAALWGSFFFSSIITLIAGYNGRKLQGSNVTLGGLPLRTVRWIGTLGAIAAVCTGFSGLAKERSESAYQCATEVGVLIRETVKDVEDESSPDLARQYLRELEVKAARC